MWREKYKSIVSKSLRTTPRSLSYIILHTQDNLHRTAKPIFDRMLDEINKMAGTNGDFKEKKYWIYLVQS